MLIWKEQLKHEIMMSLAACGAAVRLGQRAGQWWHSPCQRAASPDTITAVHTSRRLQLSNAGPPALPQLPGSPAWLTFHSWQFALMISPRSPQPRLASRHSASRRIPPSEPGRGSTCRSFPQFLQRRWPGVAGSLRALVLTPDSLCYGAITVRVRCPGSYFAS